MNKIEIINAALVELNAEPITSLTSGSKAAVMAASIYTPRLKEMLRSHPWNFAVKRTVLAPLAEAPAFGYGAAFQLPAECLRVLEVSAEGYAIEGRTIHATGTALELRYIAAADESLFDESFTAALIARLQAAMAYALTGSTTLQQAKMQEYAELLRVARSADSQEQPMDEFPESSLITVRG